jgi:hypothetical protein
MRDAWKGCPSGERKQKGVPGDHMKDGATSSGENKLLAYKEEN